MQERQRALCGALDRLLTIGSYYQPSHERFRAVAAQCEEALAAALPRGGSLEILVEDGGLAIDGGRLPAEAPEARRLFELLDPLQVALLELDGHATSDHLHLALTALKDARLNLAGSQSYREIQIKGLPETVRTTSRSLYLKTRQLKSSRRGKPAPQPETEVVFFDHNLVSEHLLTGTAQGQDCEKQFLDIIKGIMATAEPTRAPGTGAAAGSDPPDLPEEAFAAIGGVLDALSGSGSDLMNLQHLITQAQSALEISGDPELVELVFSRLQKDADKIAGRRVQPRMVGRGQTGTRGDSRRKVTMSQQQMRQLVDALPVDCGPMPDPERQAGADCLAICLQLLDLAPADQLRTGLENCLLRQLTGPVLSGVVRRTVARALQHAFTHKSPRQMLDLWPALWGPLRRSHPDHLEGLWLTIWKELSSRGRENAWPFLVNDLLLGMPCRDRIGRLLLYEGLSQVDATFNPDLRVVLENLPAVGQGSVSDDFFDAPPPLLYPVHKVLVGCSFSGHFGPLLHANLARQAPHPLSSVLLDVMDIYDPVNRPAYHAILDQGSQEELTAEMRELAPELIQETLADLHWDYMEEEWVVPAITWLGRLGQASALPVLAEILQERKYLLLRGWPRPARQAAAAARDLMRERLAYKGSQDAPDPDADPEPVDAADQAAEPTHPVES